MNQKHIALMIVGLMTFGLVQVTLWARGKKDAMSNAARAKESEQLAAIQRLDVEQSQLNGLRTASEDLMRFLQTWEPYFQSVGSAQSAEVGFTMRVKEGNLLSLSQRFEKAGVKNGGSIPEALRTYVTFEDNYPGLLNWLGRLESDLPTVRVENLRLTRGTRAGDLRMEVTMQQPLSR
ncbi:MAG: hypothetical protein Fur0032_15500 [Terrimicrobiaceae bacterium]